MSGKRSRRLGVDDWRAAALEALAEGGVAAVAIEPLARALGVTKGSGYWHFQSRDELLAAALDEWERKTTVEVITRLEALEQPRDRLIALFRGAFGSTLDSRVYVALAGVDQTPVVAAALQRAAKRRLGFLRDCFEQMGNAPERAQQRAVIAYAAYLGVVMLKRHAAGALRARDRQALVETLIETFVGAEG
ncbi:MAG: TetR/AcrR family transcriptional regulator [Myxococcales bacterium]|nr:TetR/AcrR family transcriptional regulator [Myxococcales bacterium]